MPEEGDLSTMPGNGSPEDKGFLAEGDPEGDQPSVSEETFKEEQEEQQALVAADQDAVGGDEQEAGEPTQQSKRKRNLIIGAIAVLVVIGAAVGATTGVLLSKDSNKSSGVAESFANETSTASPSVTSPTIGTPTGAPSLSCDDLIANATEKIFYVSFSGNVSDLPDGFLANAFLSAYSSLSEDDGCSPVVSQLIERRQLQDGDNTTDTSTPTPVPPTVTRIGFVVTAAQAPAEDLILGEDFVMSLNTNLAEADIIAESIEPEATSLPSVPPVAANSSNSTFPTAVPSSDMNVANTTTAPTVSPRPTITNITNTTAPTMSPSTVTNTTNTTDPPLIIDDGMNTVSPTTFTTISPSLPDLSTVQFIMEALDPVLPASTQGLINIPGTCQNWAREFLQTGSDLLEFPEHRVRQRYALAVFYCELNGDSWLGGELWVTDLHECDWYTPMNGVDPCDSNEQYQIMRHDGQRMSGTLPPEISMISSLFELSISNGTQISGTIPQDYARLSELDTLDLSENFLTGTLPDFIWLYEDLTLLSVNGNMFEGTLPDTIYSTEPNLSQLRLQKNQFSGTIPSTMSNLDWQELDLSGNFFTGTFPWEIDGTQLKELLLHNNAFSGTFPVQTYTEEAYGVDTSLTKVTLYGNLFTGSIDGMCTLFDIGSLLLLDADLDKVICQCCTGGPPSDGDGVSGDDDNDNSPAFQEVDFGIINDLITDGTLTTPLDPYVQGDCDFSDNLQPHVISQCECEGSIQILSEDILQVHGILMTYFMQVLYGEVYDAEATSCDPRNQALVWLASGDTRRSGDMLQRFVAATFYIAMNGTNWDFDNLWLSDQNECLWLGLTCDSSFRINAIDLDSMNAFGQKIPDELFLLSELRNITLVRSGISGTIPSGLFALPNLEVLKLFANGLSGAIPTSVFLASNLEVLELDTNYLTSTLPVELGLVTNLRTLSVGFNDLTRTLPTELANLSLLSMLTVDSNRISGTLPSTIGLWTSMERFLARDTLMIGSIPREVGFMTNLMDLRLTNNAFSGTIPVQMRLLNRLERLELSANRLSGTIPSEMRELTNLYLLSLSENGLSGPIPSDLGQLTNMTSLDLHSNRLVGMIPSQFASMTRISELLLDENDLTGSIPPEICDLNSLEQFVVDCPASDGTGVGIYEPATPLQEVEGNCFTICRRT